MLRKITLALFALNLFFLNSANSQTKPYQFIAKMYTEAFGRIPDPSGWQYYQNSMDSASDLVGWMRNVGISFYNNTSEFTSKYPQPSYNGARVLALFRGALNREPTQSEFYTYTTLLGYYTWSYVVNLVFNLNEFTTLANNAITRANNGKPNYGWGNNPILNLTTTYPEIGIPTSGNTITQTELQTALNNAEGSANPVVELSQMTVVFLDYPLEIPPGVTLKTKGSPLRTHYAKMARIVWRGNGPAQYIEYNGVNRIDSNMIYLNSGSSLTNLWIDGERGTVSGRNLYSRISASVRFVDGASKTGNQINDNRFSDPLGWTSLFLRGYYEGCESHDIDIHCNLFTGYATDHFNTPIGTNQVNGMADAMSIVCEDADIQWNYIVDMTDVGIVLFKSNPTLGFNQHSNVQNNMILNAGNSAFAAIALDQGKDSYAGYFEYSGTTVNENTVWTSNGAHLDVAFCIGTRSVFCHPDLPPVGVSPAKGIHGIVANNTSGVNTVNTNVAFLVDGMTDVTITQTNLIQTNNLEAYMGYLTGHNIRNSSATWASLASGSDTFTPYDADIYLSTIGHPQGVFIRGDNDVYEGETHQYTAINLGELSVSSYWWYIRRWTGSTWVDEPFNITAGSANITIPTNSNEIIWLRLDIGGLICNKFLRNLTRLPKESSEIKNEIPENYSLSQNYPNPFNPTTNIVYSIKNDGFVQLSVYNMLGEKVIDLVNKHQTAGEYTVQFDGSDLPSGVYVYRIKSNNFSDTKKLMLLK